MRVQPNGAKEVREQVIQAALCTVATTLVSWGMEKLKERWQKRPACLQQEGEVIE